MKQYAVRSETIEWWVKSPGLSTFNPTLAAERYTEEDKREALAKGVGRVNEASLDKGRPPRTWFDIPRENSRSKERQYGKHPSMKPMPLAERLINVHTNRATRWSCRLAAAAASCSWRPSWGARPSGLRRSRDTSS